MAKPFIWKQNKRQHFHVWVRNNPLTDSVKNGQNMFCICLDESKIRLSLPKPFRILLKFVEQSLEIFDSRPYLFAISICQIRSSNGISTFNPPPPGWAKLVLGSLITRQAGRDSHGKIAKLQRKCSRKTLFRSLNVQTLILLKGEKKTKVLKKQRLMLGAKWDFGNPGSP